MRRPPARRRALVAFALCAQAAFVVSGTQTANAAAAQLPFTVTNNSGRAVATYIYVVARNGSTGQQGYVDAGGTWHAYPFPASIPSGTPLPAAPDVSIAGPATGTSKTITLAPNLSGGRIYFSMGSKLQFFMTTSGLVEPAPWVATDPNANVLYDWTEFARASNGGNGIFINSTTVDMFSMPVSVKVTSSAGATQTEGITNGRQNLLDGLNNLGAPWTNLRQTAADGTVLRVLAPTHGIGNGIFSSTYFDNYVNASWTYFQSHTLTIDTAWGAFTGTVSGTTMNVKNASGGVVGTIARPTTKDVFGCEGALQPTANEPDVPGILAFGARICAAFHRATMSTASRVMFDHQPTTDASQYYGQTDSDLFSKVIHANSLNGKAYGFAYDDVAAQAPTIDQPDPASAGMTIATFGTATGGGGGGGGTVTGNVIAAPGGKCVDIPGNDTGGNGAIAQLWDCQATAIDQHYTASAGQLKTLGRCLDITGNGTANSTKVELWDCNTNGGQLWTQTADGSLKNPQSGRCLDSPGGATANGTQLQIYDCNQSPAQKFSIAGGTGLTVGGTGGVSATSTIQAESFNGQSGTFTETTTDTGGGQNIGAIGNGDWLQYNSVNFGTTGLGTFNARVASGAAAGVSGTVEVHLDALTNPSIGSFSIANTGGWQSWRTTPAAISTTTGTHTVFLKFVTGAGADFVNVNWLTFS